MNSIQRVERKIEDGWNNPARISDDKFRLYENNLKVFENDLKSNEISASLQLLYILHV